MAKCELTIRLDRDDPTCRPGETVRGHVSVALGDQSVACHGLTLKHLWRTHGRGNRYQATMASQKLFEGEWRAGETHQYPFELTMPAGPATYHGQLLNVDHYLVAEADVPWSIDPEAELELLLLGVDSPTYDSGPEYKKPETNIRAPGEGSNIASYLAGGCLGLPGLAMIVGAVAGAGISRLFFGIALAAVGFGLVYALEKRRFAQQWTRTPLVEVGPSMVRPGEVVNVKLFMAPRIGLNLEYSCIKLVGREKVVSGSGTHRQTHTQEAYWTAQSLHTEGRRVEPNEELALQQSITLPEDAPPTFMTDDNELTWTVVIDIGIKGWPDWEQEYPLTVRPSGNGKPANVEV